MQRANQIMLMVIVLFIIVGCPSDDPVDDDTGDDDLVDDDADDDDDDDDDDDATDDDDGIGDDDDDVVPYEDVCDNVSATTDPVYPDIAYTVSWASSITHLWVMNTESGESKNLIEPLDCDGIAFSVPCYLPSESRIAFVGATNGNAGGVFSIGIDGEEFIQHTWTGLEQQESGGFGFPALACSPTSATVAHTRNDGSLYLLDVSQSGTVSEEIEVPIEVSSIAWSADGAKLIISGEGVVLLEADGSDPEVILQFGDEARLSEDQTRVIYTVPIPGEWGYMGALYIANADGTGNACIEEAWHSANQYVGWNNPSITPDGEHIIVETHSHDDNSDPNFTAYIDIMDVDDGPHHQPLSSSLEWAQSFDISADGETVIFSGAEWYGDSPNLFLNRLDGSQLTALTHDEEEEWTPIFLD